MSERLRVLDKCVKDKIDDCLKYLMEMKEIETQVKLSCGIDPCISTSYASKIDLWLQSWKKIDINLYTCLLDSLAQKCSKMKVQLRAIVVLVRMISRGIEVISPAGEANLSRLEAFHEEHLQEEVHLLEEHLSKIRGDYRLLADQLRSKFV